MKEKDLLTALGPLAGVYQDPAVAEIMVDAPDRVYVERQGRLEDAGVTFASGEAIRAVINAVLALGGIKLEVGETLGNVSLPNGSRLAAVLPPTALRGPCFVLRKITSTAITWERLLEWGCLTQEAHDLLQAAVRARKTILMTGGTGSGKTTVVNLLAGFIPPEERVAVIEEVHDYQVDLPRLIYLEAGGPAKTTVTDLLHQAARMRPDRLIISELHGPEALTALQIVNLGYDGALLNMHANDVPDALRRLEGMCLMANSGLGLLDIRATVATALDLIIHQQRLPSGVRRIMQISEIGDLDNDRLVLRDLFRYNPAADRLEPTGELT